MMRTTAAEVLFGLFQALTGILITLPDPEADVPWVGTYTRRGRYYLHQGRTLRELVGSLWAQWRDPLLSDLPVFPSFDRAETVTDFRVETAPAPEWLALVEDLRLEPSPPRVAVQGHLGFEWSMPL